MSKFRRTPRLRQPVDPRPVDLCLKGVVTYEDVDNGKIRPSFPDCLKAQWRCGPGCYFELKAEPPSRDRDLGLGIPMILHLSVISGLIWIPEPLSDEAISEEVTDYRYKGSCSVRI